MSLTVPGSVLEEARVFMEERGSFGVEGTAMMAGTPDGQVRRLVIPTQIAHRSALGVSVEVGDEGKRELAAALDLHERWLTRIHSHPGEAFHSPTDDDNPVLTAEGSISIVAPYFGLGLRRGLSACAVLILADGRWRKAQSDELPVVIDD
jgi:hypothetical protein